MQTHQPNAHIERIRPEEADERIRVLGWVVRQEDPETDAYFPDATYGGREESYRAAEAWLEAAGDVDEEDTANIDRIERPAEAGRGWVLRWKEPDPRTGEIPRPETFRVHGAPDATDAFERVLQHLREVREDLAAVLGDPDELSIEVEDERAVLRQKEQPLAVADYEDRLGKQAEAKGYRVRIRRQYTTHTKYFSDRLLGGRLGALRAAQYWRDLRKGERPQGEDHPVPDALTLDPEVDNYRLAAIERSQFGVPRLSVILRTLESGNTIPYVKASWPVTKDRSRDKYVSLEGRSVEEATREICKALVHARRTSDLSPSDLGNRATPFDILDGWFADTERPVEEEVDALMAAVLPGVCERARDVLERWRRKKRGIPGVRIRVKKNENGRYGAFLQARWRGPEGEWVARETEIEGADVESALERLAEKLVRYEEKVEDAAALRRGRRSPFSVMTPKRPPTERVEHLVDIGLPSLTARFKELQQGVPGVRLTRKNIPAERDMSGEGGRPPKRYTVFVAWPAATGPRRRQKSFDKRSELQGALKTVVERALRTVRKSRPEDRSAALGEGSPFEGATMEDLQSDTGIRRLTRRVVRRALPSLRLRLEHLSAEKDAESGTPE